MSVPFGVGQFEELLSAGSPGSGYELQEPASDIGYQEETRQDPTRANPLTVVMQEIAVLGDIVRRGLPIGEVDGQPKFASPGEFRDLKEAIHKELFAPKAPKGVVTQADLNLLITALQKELADIRGAIAEKAAEPVQPEKPAAPAKKGAKA